jgi:hypothetical protein
LFDAGLLPALSEPTKSALECGLSLWLAGQVGSRVTASDFEIGHDSRVNQNHSEKE